MLNFNKFSSMSRRVTFSAVAAVGLTGCEVPGAPDTSYEQNGTEYSRGNVNLPANCSLVTNQPVTVRPDGTVVGQQGSGRIVCSGDSNPKRRSQSIQDGLREAANTVNAVNELAEEIRYLQYLLD